MHVKKRSILRSITILPLFGLLVVASPQAEPTPATAPADLAAFSQQLDQLTNALGLTSQAPLPTTINPTPLTGHQLPGPNVAQAILTGVPASFYVAMANPSGRASISSAMAAGNMPEWYNNLPDEAQDYIYQLRTEQPTWTTGAPARGQTAASGGSSPASTSTTKSSANTVKVGHTSAGMVLLAAWYLIT